MVNTFIAAIMAHYCSQWVLQREISVLSTAFNLSPPVMTSRRLTLTALAEAFIDGTGGQKEEIETD